MPETNPPSSSEQPVPVIALRLDRHDYDAIVAAAQRLHLPVASITKSIVAEAVETSSAQVLQERRHNPRG